MKENKFDDPDLTFRRYEGLPPRPCWIDKQGKIFRFRRFSLRSAGVEFESISPSGEKYSNFIDGANIWSDWSAIKVVEYERLKQEYLKNGQA